RERILFTGDIETELSDDEVARVVRRVEEIGVESVAICLLHSYANPEHEQRLKHALQDALPAVRVSASSEIWPQMREYERAVATTMNAYVAPIMARYVESLE